MISIPPETVSHATNSLLQTFSNFNSIMTWIYVGIGTAGIIMNLGVIYIILQSKRMRQHIPNWFLINQSAADFWSAIFVIGTVFKNANTKLSGSTGDFICRVWLGGMPLWIGLVASLYNLVILSFERFFEIVHPVRHKIIFNRRIAMLSIIGVWIWSLVWNTIIFIPPSGLINGTCYTQYFWESAIAKSILGVLNFSVKMTIPVGVFLFCYISIAKSLNSKVMPSANIIVMRVRRNVFKTLMYVIIIHVLSWSVNQALYLAYLFGYNLYFSSALHSVPLVLVFLSTCSNPIIYLLKYERFRTAVTEAFSCRISSNTKMNVFALSTGQ